MSISLSSGMILSVFVVMLLTVFYELFKVWRVWLEIKSEQPQPRLKYTHRPHVRSDSTTVLESSQSEISLTPGELTPAVNIGNRSGALWNPPTGWYAHSYLFIYIIWVCLTFILSSNLLCFSDGCFTPSRHSSTFCRSLWATCWCSVSCRTTPGSSLQLSWAPASDISSHTHSWIGADGVEW